MGREGKLQVKRSKVMESLGRERYNVYGRRNFKPPSIFLRAQPANSLVPAVLIVALGLLLSACRVGPDYKRPPVDTPAAYKETPAATPSEAGQWAPAQPNDAL